MTGITHTTSFPIRNSSVQSLGKNLSESASATFLLAGYATALPTGTTLANVVAREILGLCNPLALRDRTGSYYPCAYIWKPVSSYGQISLALLTAGLALSYGPAVLEKIKSLSLFGEVKTSSEIKPKGRDIDLFTLATNPAVMITAISGTVAARQFIGSLFTLSELAVRNLSESCIYEIELKSNEPTAYNYCESLTNKGSAELLATGLATGLALAALGVSYASLRLIGKISRSTNKG